MYLEGNHPSYFVRVGAGRSNFGRMISPLFSNRYHNAASSTVPSMWIPWNLEGYSEWFRLKSDNLNIALG